MVKLDRICREANVMLIFARSYGLTGLVRISLKVASWILVDQLLYSDIYEKFLLEISCYIFIFDVQILYIMETSLVDWRC